MMRRSAGCTSSSYGGRWACIGPDDVPEQVMGFVNAVWADTASESGYMLAGTVYGGLFKTTDAGANWENITDNAPIAGGLMGVTNIVVDAKNIDTIYLGTAGAGILFSADRGATWQQDFVPRGGDPRADTIETTFVYLTEDGKRIYVTCGSKLFTRATDSTLWHDITPPIDSIVGFANMAFVPGHPDHFFIAGADSSTYHGTPNVQTGFIFESKVAIPSPIQWNEITTSFFDLDDIPVSYLVPDGMGGWITVFARDTAIYHANDMRIFKISVPDTNNLYTICKPIVPPSIPHDFTTGLYKYSFGRSSPTWSVINRNLPPTSNPNTPCFEIKVSAADTNHIYFAETTPHFSFNEGRSFIEIGRYGGDITHGDIRDIYLQHASAGDTGRSDRVYFATDGGVSEKPAGKSIMADSSRATINVSGHGLNCGMYWSFATGEADAGIGGMMHDGIVTYEPGDDEKWKSMEWAPGIYGSDAWVCDIDRVDPYKGYGWESYSDLRTTNPVGSRHMGEVDVFPTPPWGIFPQAGKPLATDAFGTVYCADNELWRKRSIDTVFINSSIIGVSGWGFPDLVLHDTLMAKQIALNPYDTTFEGYVLFNPGAQIFYRHYPAFPSAISISSPPGSPTYYPVNWMATDPNNTERIWVCQDGVWNNDSTNAQYRVEYSADHGNTWVDISRGLPFIPVNRIVYDEVANMLYCCTDAGIYRCDMNDYDTSAIITVIGGHMIDTAVHWTCFNDGAVAGKDFPNVTVNDLRINHCEGKLYAATLGRSVWATDLYPTGTIVNANTTITTNTIWNGGSKNRYVNGSIRIQPGVTFTITGRDTVHMPKNGVIIVEPGAKLIIDSAVITNSCEDCFWQGIQVRGNTGLPQTAANQGVCIIKNNSILQHANIAVSNCNTPEDSVYGSTGGIIKAESSTFKNNHNSVTFRVYDNWNLARTVLSPNVSYFNNCTFVLDNNYKGNDINYPMAHMVYLDDVEGVDFTGCKFLNRDTAGIQRGLGDGIYARNAGFAVKPGCPPGIPCWHPTIPSRMCGFTNGIAIRGTMSYDPGTSIDQTTFDSCSVGVNVATITNVSTTSNHFIIGNGRDVRDVYSGSFLACKQNIGIMTQNTAQFRIEANVFDGKANGVTDWFNFGTVVASSGLGTGNIVYHNTYDSLTIGVEAIGINTESHLPGHTGRGLRILCNDFYDNDNDIYVDKDTAAAFIIYEGVDGIQGVPTSTGHIAAGNTFNGAGNNIVNGLLNIEYYYNALAGAELPSHVSSNPGYPTGNVFLIAATDANTCLPTYSGDVSSSHGTMSSLSMPELRTYKTDFRTKSSIYSDSLALYTGRTDYGNTDSLVSIIHTSTDTAALYTILNGCTPYLSGTALRAVAFFGKMPYYSMMLLMKQNPDNLHDPGFVKYMYDAYSLGSDDMDTLHARSQHTTARTPIEGAMAGRLHDIAVDANIIMMALKTPIDTSVSLADTTNEGICMDTTSIYYLLDSNSYYVGMDGIDRWLRNTGGLWSMYERVGYYRYRGEMGIADSIFSGIGSQLPQGSVPDAEAHSDYTALWNVIKSATSDSRSLYQLDSAEIASLDTCSTPVVMYSVPRVMITDLSLLISGGDVGVIHIPCFYPEGYESRSGIADNQPPIVNVNANGKRKFNVYPNPSNGIVTFSYNIPDGCSDVKLLITNILGETVMEQNTGNNSGSINWDPRGLPSGIYVYKASCGKGNISMGKIVLVR